MRIIVIAVALAAVTACSSPAVKGSQASGGTMTAAVMDPYLNIEEALAQDSLDQVKINAGNLATAASSLGGPAMKIDTSAIQLAAADDLESARDRFGALSEAVVDYMNGFKLTPPEGVRQAWCPMAQKPWLQRGGMLANPYYGKAMPTCGEFK
jgi:hypothetical protein